jgi:hypothetical protein
VIQHRCDVLRRAGRYKRVADFPSEREIVHLLEISKDQTWTPSVCFAIIRLRAAVAPKSVQNQHWKLYRVSSIPRLRAVRATPP